MEYYAAFHGEYHLGILVPDQDYGVFERRVLSATGYTTIILVRGNLEVSD